MIAAFNFTYIYAYVGPPIAGAISAGLFYEFVFVKSQEFLHVDETESDDSQKGEESQGTRKTDDAYDEDAHQIDAWYNI